MNDKRSPSKMEAKDLDLYYGDFQALKKINLAMPEHTGSPLLSGRPAAANPPSLKA